MGGAPSRKPTTLAGTGGQSPGCSLSLESVKVKCVHSRHKQLFGLNEDGSFVTRAAQSYPSEFCLQLAKIFIEDFRVVGMAKRIGDESIWDPGTVEDVKELGVAERIYEMGERVPCPEVAACWGPLERWKEEARWRFSLMEHNNILEARAGVGAIIEATRRRS